MESEDPGFGTFITHLYIKPSRKQLVDGNSSNSNDKQAWQAEVTASLL
jgi:hypothetical protein